MARLSGAMRLPVEVGLTDDQLEYFLRDAIDGCGFFERFLEEAFPQTRLDTLAKQAGIRIPDPVEEILAELDGQPEGVWPSWSNRRVRSPTPTWNRR